MGAFNIQVVPKFDRLVGPLIVLVNVYWKAQYVLSRKCVGQRQNILSDDL